jgi:hypothetical protein
VRLFQSAHHGLQPQKIHFRQHYSLLGTHRSP